MKQWVKNNTIRTKKSNYISGKLISTHPTCLKTKNLYSLRRSIKQYCVFYILHDIVKCTFDNVRQD